MSLWVYQDNIAGFIFGTRPHMALVFFYSRHKEGFSMDSGMVSKIQKAKRYAQEPDRVVFEEFRVVFKGDHDTYRVSYVDGKWSCQCHFFQQRGVCSHTMAMERLLDPMRLAQPEEVA